MNNLNNFVFFNNKSTVGESDNVLLNPNGGSQLILQVHGTVTGLNLSIQGCVDIENNEYIDLAIINASNYNVVSNITDVGIYIIGVDGVGKIKATIDTISTGSVNVFGKLGE